VPRPSLEVAHAVRMDVRYHERCVSHDNESRGKEELKYKAQTNSLGTVSEVGKLETSRSSRKTYASPSSDQNV